MKKKVITGISVIFLLILLTFTSPAQAADYAGHDFSEDHFAVEIDLYPNAAIPDVIYDFETGVEGTDSIPETDLQFFMSYMNKSGIEVAYSALEKMEHWIKFRDLLPDDVGDLIDTLGPLAPAGAAEALDTNLVHVNATAPFQQLVQHFNTPWGTDAFVTNNFMTLVAYSGGTGSDPLLMDSGDNLYMGYTFAIQEVAAALNTAMAPHYEIPPFDYEASFEQTADGYTFGINYTNMFVLWQDITVKLRGPDYLSAVGLQLPETKGIIYGQDIVAASVLDHLAFEYIFKVEEIDLGTTPSIKVNLGTVETRYHIGETNLLVTKDDSAFITAHAADWIDTPFTATPSYTLDVPPALQGQTVGTWTFPSSVTLTLSEMAFFINDDAKVRMSMADAFGLTVVTATNWFDTQVVSNPQFATHLDEPEDPTIDLQKDGNVFFWTSFKNKMNYKLRELDFAPFNINATTDRDVYVTLFDPSGWFAANVAKPYFIVEFSLAWAFTVFIANKVAPEIVHPGVGQHTEVINQLLYLTFTEFPEWYGGEIYHDPSYSAVAAVAAQPETTSDGPSGSDTNGLNIPGFELISVLVALPVFYASYRKRR
ncbi:MAG: Heimdall-CTERM domain-containing surface protein [Candidatus Hodarchaeales archaeon]|jgi:hypothetical protein